LEKKLRESEERYFLATQGANDGLWDWDVKSKEIYFSPRWKSMLGYSDSEIGSSPMDWFSKIHPTDKEQVEEKIKEHLQGKPGHFESEYRILDASGAYRWVLCRGLARRDENGEVYRFAGSQTDITDRKVYNPLTGLPNKILFMDRLEHTLQCAGHEVKAFGVAAIRFSNVQTIASSLGYVFVDRLIRLIGRRIQEYLSAHDTVAHFGNDDFFLLLEKVCDERQATIVASQLQSVLEQPFQIGEQTVYVAAHIGITLRTREYNYPEELIRDAHTAMRRSQENGKVHFEIFEKKMRGLADIRLKLEVDLRKALENKEFRIYYQPIIDLGTGWLAGVEALLRWQRQNELLYPKDFLSIAESIDLLIPIERWVLLESCTQAARWEQKHKKLFTLNVNLCPKHYTDPYLISYLQEVLHRSKLPPRSLRLEITESALMENTEVVSSTLANIRAMRVQLHMDDFGTGYSSLSYLNRFPIDSLKIDRSFVGSLGLNEETWKIVQAIVNLGKNLDMELIAEGIENMLQLRMLQTLKCEYGQGYYFAKPMEPSAIENLFSGQIPWAMAFDADNLLKFPRVVEAR